jgi:hypothetical protein
MINKILLIFALFILFIGLTIIGQLKNFMIIRQNEKCPVKDAMVYIWLI